MQPKRQYAAQPTPEFLYRIDVALQSQPTLRHKRSHCCRSLTERGSRGLIARAMQPEGTTKMVIIHSNAFVKPSQLPVDLFKKEDFIVLAGPRGVFDALDLPVVAGKAHGCVLRVEQVKPCSSAFELLAECAPLFQSFFAEHLVGLSYLRPEGDFLQAIVASVNHVTWKEGSDGEIEKFSLSPTVASSPLLAPLTKKLAARPLNDNRRFALLAAAFVGA